MQERKFKTKFGFCKLVFKIKESLDLIWSKNKGSLNLKSKALRTSRRKLTLIEIVTFFAKIEGAISLLGTKSLSEKQKGIKIR
jgi:hypothetical protein